MTIKSDPVPLNEPATFFSSPDDGGSEFGTLADALVFACDIPEDERHRRAQIRTHSGDVYGWNAIVQLRKNVPE